MDSRHNRTRVRAAVYCPDILPLVQSRTPLPRLGSPRACQPLPTIRQTVGYRPSPLAQLEPSPPGGSQCRSRRRNRVQAIQLIFLFFTCLSRRRDGVSDVCSDILLRPQGDERVVSACHRVRPSPTGVPHQAPVQGSTLSRRRPRTYQCSAPPPTLSGSSGSA